MGAVTARAAGVEEVVVAAPAHPVTLAACALCEVDAVYRMGGAQAIAALAYGTETVAPVDVIVGPGNLYVQEAKRQVSGVVGIDGFAGPSDLLVILTVGADPVVLAADLAAQAEHGEDSLVVAVSDDPDLLDALGGIAIEVLAESPEAALAFADAFAPEHLQLAGAAAEALALRVRHAGCLFVGVAAGTAFGDYVAGSNHVLPTGGRRPLRLRALGAPLPPPHGRGADRPRRGGGARARRRPARAGRGVPAPRRLDGDPGESAGMTPRSARIERRTGETNVSLTVGLASTGAGTRATGVGFLDHMLDLVARHGRLDLDVEVTGDLQTGSHHTVEDTGIVLGQALDQALADRRGIVRYGYAVIPMDEARAACAIDVSGRPLCATAGFERLPPGDIAGFEHEAAEEFFRAVASAAKLTLHVEIQAGTNAHHMIEACFKAFARALRTAVAEDPREGGIPSTKGTLT